MAIWRVVNIYNSAIEMRNIFFFPFFFLSIISTSHAFVLKSGWEPWPPFQYVDIKTGEPTGFDIELISAIFNKMLCKPKFIVIHWDAHLLRLKDGSLDFAQGASYSAEREEYAYFSEPYRSETVNLYVLKGRSNKYKFKSLADIKGSSFRLGVTSGYYYGREYSELIKNPMFKKHVNETNVDLAHSKMLVLDRIDGFLMDNIAAHKIITAKNLWDKIEIHPMKVYSCGIHVMFSKKSVQHEIVEAFNNELSQFKESGEYKKILKKYRGIR